MDPLQRAEALTAAFTVFDAEKKGVIPGRFLVTVLGQFGNCFTSEELQEFTTDAFDENGMVDYRKFVKEVVFGSA